MVATLDLGPQWPKCSSRVELGGSCPSWSNFFFFLHLVLIPPEDGHHPVYIDLGCDILKPGMMSSIRARLPRFLSQYVLFIPALLFPYILSWTIRPVTRYIFHFSLSVPSILAFCTLADYNFFSFYSFILVFLCQSLSWSKKVFRSSDKFAFASASIFTYSRRC